MKTLFLPTLYFILSFSTFLSAKEEPLKEEISGREKLLSVVAGEWIAQSTYAAAKLDIAGFLLKGNKSVEELAKLANCNEESLYRLLRMLASTGLFHEEKDRNFSNTPASELLAKDHPQSLRSLILFYSEEMSESWASASECLKEGKPAFTIHFGRPVFDYFREKPQSGTLFRAAMKEKSNMVVSSCLSSFDFSRFNTFYDIGGGMGHFLSALLHSFPQTEGTLYELPEVIAAAHSSFSSFNRATLISGNFFQNVPKGGDAYLLKSVLHDWSDADCLTILQKCHEAMPNAAKLIIIEPIMNSANQKDPAKIMDVYMMMITGGRERTKNDFQNLLEQTGFVIESITPTETEFFLIEARKK